MFWIHCNACGSQPCIDKADIFVSNCGHFFCKQCLQQSNADKVATCFVCKSSPVRFLKVDKHLKRDILAMLEEPTFALKRACRVVNFQEAQAHNLYTLLRKNVAAFGTRLKSTSEQAAVVQDQLLGEKKRNQALNEECSRLRMDLKNLATELDKVKTENKHLTQHQHQHQLDQLAMGQRPANPHQNRHAILKPSLPFALNESSRDLAQAKITQSPFNASFGLNQGQGGYFSSHTFADLPTNIFSAAKTPDVFRIGRSKLEAPRQTLDEGLFGRPKTSGHSKFPFVT